MSIKEIITSILWESVRWALFITVLYFIAGSFLGAIKIIISVAIALAIRVCMYFIMAPL